MATQQQLLTPDVNEALWGTPHNLTPPEREALDAFRSQVSDVDLMEMRFGPEPLESVCCRFLRARKFDVTKAVTLMTEAQARVRAFNPPALVQKGLEGAVQCALPAYQQTYPHTEYGVDKLNRLGTLCDHLQSSNRCCHSQACWR